jgi:hypothetical protein
MGFAPRSSWKGVGFISCINCMRKSRKFMGFGFRAKAPKFEKSRFNWEKCKNIVPTTL